MADPDLQCPGREKCLIYLTDPGECTDCPGVADRAKHVSPLLLRVLDIDELAASGCTFALGDLMAQEWMGREALRAARAEIAQKARETQDGR